MTWICLALLVVMVVLTILQRYLERKERMSMTVEKFLARCKEYVRKKDERGMSAFMVRHLSFMVKHKGEIEAELARLKNLEERSEIPT